MKHVKIVLATAALMLVAASAAVLLIVASTAFAHAETAQSGGLIQLSAFGWLQPYVDSAVQALIVVFFGWIGKSKYTQWLDQSARDALETFVKNQASALIAKGAVSMQGKTVKVDNALLYQAASLSSTMIPGALNHFGLTADVVSAKIVAAIPQTVVGAEIVAAAHASAPPA